MFKLFLKNQILFFLILALMGSALYYYDQDNNAYTLRYNVNVAARTMFDLAQERLSQVPQNQWPSYLQSLQPEHGLALTVLSTAQLPPTLAENPALQQGRIVDWPTQQDHETLPMVYQKIPHSDHYLQLQVAPSLAETYQHNSAWIATLLRLNLQQLPPAQWPNYLQTLSKRWDMPISLITRAQLSPQQQQQIAHWQLAFSAHDHGNISTVFLPTPNPEQWVQLGPYTNVAIARYRLPLMALLVVLLVLLISWLWTRPFYQALTRLNQLAQRYGQGQFGATELTLSKRSGFYPLYQGMTQMAAKIETLIASHKTLTNTVAHELRTPLSRVRFITHRLASKVPEAQHYVAELTTEVAELEQLIDEMLTYVRFDHDGIQLDLTPKPIYGFLQQLISEQQYHHPQRTWRLSDTCTQPAFVRFDEYYFKRTLTNLLANALHYSHHTVVLTVSCADQTCTLSVDDDGPGVPVADRERIFNAFERGTTQPPAPHPGYGLGLAIAQRIVKLHSGTLTVDTAPLGGARFSITLPCMIGDPT